MMCTTDTRIPGGIGFGRHSGPSWLQKSGSYRRKQPLLVSTHTPEAKLTCTELARKYILPLACSPGEIKNDLTFHHFIWWQKHLFQEASGSFFFSKSQGLRERMQLNQNSYTTLPTYKYYRKKILLKAEKYKVFLLKATSFFKPMRKYVPPSRKPWGQEYSRARPPPGRSSPPPSTAAVSPVISRTSLRTHPGPQVPIQ